MIVPYVFVFLQHQYETLFHISTVQIYLIVRWFTYLCAILQLAAWTGTWSHILVHYFVLFVVILRTWACFCVLVWVNLHILWVYFTFWGISSPNTISPIIFPTSSLHQWTPALSPPVQKSIPFPSQTKFHILFLKCCLNHGIPPNSNHKNSILWIPPLLPQLSAPFQIQPVLISHEPSSIKSYLSGS